MKGLSLYVRPFCLVSIYKKIYYMKKLDKDSLVAEFDIRNYMSWLGSEADLSITSLVKQAKYNDVNLEQTPFVENMYDAGVFTFNQVFSNTLSLFPVVADIPYNPYETFDVTPMNDEIAGLYFDFSGGLLTGNFAFERTAYNILPKRYINGFSFQVNIHVDARTFGDINESNDGIFLYLGARSENKRLPLSGMSEDVNGNMIAFKFNDEGRIGYKYLNADGFIVEDYSHHSIKSHGWKLVTISYIPEGTILPHLAHCMPRRRGELCIYINGLPYLTIPNFEEPVFSDYSSEDNSTLGLPYAITLGGGSFGLRHVIEVTPEGDIIETGELGDAGIIGKHFGGNFHGGIQVLRIFDKHMLFDEVIERYNNEAVDYGLSKFEGGRIIKYER
jgi:hypothetical protein